MAYSQIPRIAEPGFLKSSIAISVLALGCGCDAQIDCASALNIEFQRASTLRAGRDGTIRRPTSDESNTLRQVVENCEADLVTFSLSDSLSKGEPWGSATTILLAVELDDADLLDSLVSKGHPANGLPNDLGLSTLHFATYRKAESAFRWALGKGIDPNLADAEGITPLMYAAVQEQDGFPAIRELLNAGANIDAKTNDGLTALSLAIGSGFNDNSVELVEAGASVSEAREGLVRSKNSRRGEEGNARIQSLIDYLDQTFGSPARD